jgi:hypothetical protein
MKEGQSVRRTRDTRQLRVAGGPNRGSEMNGTNTRPAGQRGRHPSSTVDSQLAHLENVVGYMAQWDAAPGAQQVFDHGYWEKRIRQLESSYELLGSQRLRAAKLIERLGRATQA